MSEGLVEPETTGASILLHAFLKGSEVKIIPEVLFRDMDTNVLESSKQKNEKDFASTLPTKFSFSHKNVSSVLVLARGKWFCRGDNEEARFFFEHCERRDSVKYLVTILIDC